MNQDELRHLATQLSHPEGEFGIYLAENMNETNIGMTRNSIANLNLSANDSVMELGHGNCGHLNELLSIAEGIWYEGFEISETMHSEAKRLNPDRADNVHFSLYDGVAIPAVDDHFDKAFSANTLYFWPDVVKMLNEINRVLKPGGIFCLTFAEKDSMEQLAFTGFVFRLYMPDDIEKLLGQTNFTLSRIDRQYEDVMSKMGHHIKRHFVTMVLSKTKK
ncbi:class I SAM-dependent methyltransferase [Flavobacterium selenitireducens]|uniref:class I SAM-dependent methyltransferase n=1 Tax=Flavobacterium selenitireducens TaxID=2722704 RepID=UPI00168ADA3E|nr:class I SAM-dependent methyltransferase [Flavobacterium selenitireducens]MBD3582714.1 class I SAM-dependent methyltransferase [Flavobacterium selenitireducens]